MSKQGLLLLLIVLVSIGSTGCSSLRKNLSDEALHADRQLVFDKAKDYTYLVVLDAVTQIPGWELYFTDKTSGKIAVYDSRFKELMNTDERVITIWVKPLERSKTTVSLDEGSVRKLRANELLDAIEQRMGRVTSQVLKPPPQQAQIPAGV